MEIKITWYGTACFIITLGNYCIMLDPFFDRNAKSQPVLTTKKEEVPPIDAILVTHAHFDHITSIPYFLHRDHCRVLGDAQVKPNVTLLGIGEGLPDLPDKIDPSDLVTVESVFPDTAYPLQKNNETIATVTPIQSKHIRFDAYQIFRVLFNLEVIRNRRKLLALGRKLPKGNVLGWEIMYQGKRIVVFGSLHDKTPDYFTKFSPCDLLFIPLAGRNHITKPGLNVSRALQPRRVIPTHYDHFFPPISQWTDISQYEARMNQEMPQTSIIRPGIGTPFVVDL